MNNENSHTNRLIQETSPYLLQHANNPVDWYSWGPEALAAARQTGKPILLSIGYSACHWCHVMAHESFEDETTAQLMNRLFINIKVDREERPDLDKIYQTAFQLLNGRGGGWPLTMFLTHDDQVPFLGGTYFPNQARYGMPSFCDVLEQVSNYYQTHGNEVRQQNAALLEALKSTSPKAADDAVTLTLEPLQAAIQQLARSFDSRYGGFGPAPKFPHPTHIEQLLRHIARNHTRNHNDSQTATMAFLTLHAMAVGGIYDHIGGGFCRYSVDERWTIPHFEKMLYDNGPLLALYSEAWRVTNDSLFKQVVEQTAQWAIREMQSLEGGFYAAFDADSEGQEGKFYLWTPEAVRALLNDDEYRVFAPYFGLDQPANFEGHWHLRVMQPLGTVAEAAHVLAAQAEAWIASARQKLLAVRQQRVWPLCDDKHLTAWNALMIKGLVIAGRHLQRPEWIASARRAVSFIQQHLWQNERLLSVYKNGKTQPAYLDDYALLLDALLELLQVHWQTDYLQWAIQLADGLLTHFQDAAGGFYFTAHDHETLIHRPKPIYDDALPAGNGIAAYNLCRLGHLLGREDYVTAAERTLKWAWPHIKQMPVACNALLLALEAYCTPGQWVVIRGAEADIAAWQAVSLNGYHPQRMTLAIPSEVTDLPGLLAERRALTTPVAYLCSGFTCQAPITDIATLERALHEGQWVVA